MENDVSLIECFELQLSEVEMLSSMYPNSDEFLISCPFVLKDMHRFVSGETKYLPNQLDLTLNLKTPETKDTFEVYVCFPHKYPFTNPEICVRSVGLNRFQQGQLNSAMAEFIHSFPLGDICVLSVINWLMENAEGYFSVNKHTEETIKTESNTIDELCRMWIYSHHIYNKFKRREIVDCGEDMNLTGFSLPGKPGFICIEGYKRDCSEFLQHLKQMSWKKISLIKEEIEHSTDMDINEFRKFDNFSEISFQVRRGPAKEYHMDMGEFLKYLTEHNCAYAFQDLFGLEGQTSSDK